MVSGVLHRWPPLGGNNDNALVPGNACIQPPAAFVVVAPQLLAVLPAAAGGDGINLDCSNQGITELIDDPASPLGGDANGLYAAFGFCSTFNLSGNNLIQTTVDNLLAALAFFYQYYGGPLTSFDISGGTNAVPTGGQANVNLVALRTAHGMTVTTN